MCDIVIPVQIFCFNFIFSFLNGWIHIHIAIYIYMCGMSCFSWTLWIFCTNGNLIHRSSFETRLSDSIDRFMMHRINKQGNKEFRKNQRNGKKRRDKGSECKGKRNWPNKWRRFLLIWKFCQTYCDSQLVEKSTKRKKLCASPYRKRTFLRHIFFLNVYVYVWVYVCARLRIKNQII